MSFQRNIIEFIKWIGYERTLGSQSDKDTSSFYAEDDDDPIR